MADRILVFHSDAVRRPGDSIGPTYYMEADCAPLAVRIHAEKAPTVGDASFDITQDGVSIFANQTPERVYPERRLSYVAETKKVELPKGQTNEELADDFVSDLAFTAGGWVQCVLKNAAGGENFTIQLELENLSEPDESDE